MLMRVLLICSISKAQIFIPEEEEWKRRKGMLFGWNNDLKTSMKVGIRSAFLCQKYGIELSEEEFECLISLDNEDDTASRFRSPLATMGKSVKMFTDTALRVEYMQLPK